MSAFNNEAMKLAAMGVTIVVSSGDNGAMGDEDYCDYSSSSEVYSTYWKVGVGGKGMVFDTDWNIYTIHYVYLYGIYSVCIYRKRLNKIV